MIFFRSIYYTIKNTFNFSGRSSRSEYWYYHFFILLVLFVTSWSEDIIARYLYVDIKLVSAVIIIICVAPMMSSFTRRLHDVDKSFGDYIDTQYIWNLPRAFSYIKWLLEPGTVGPNRFGPDPLDYEIL